MKQWIHTGKGYQPLIGLIFVRVPDVILQTIVGALLLPNANTLPLVVRGPLFSAGDAFT